MMPHVREDQLEVLKVLYPWYKEEVYRRRDQMMRLTGFASAFLVLLLATMLATPVHPHRDLTVTVFAGTGVALFTGIFVYLILQQRDRHRMAKRVLIELERSLGFFEEGAYLDERALYPEEWRTAWRTDRSVTVYITVLTTLTVLVIAALVLRA